MRVSETVEKNFKELLPRRGATLGIDGVIKQLETPAAKQ